MSDQNLETECFGGDYKVPQSTNSKWFCLAAAAKPTWNNIFFSFWESRAINK